MTESGNEIQAITDKQYLTVNSGHGDESVIYLTFSSANKDSVDEIIKKSDKFPDSDYLSLLPEIADILHCTVSELQSRPHEMLDILTETYINYWHSDRQAIQNALERITDLNRETENELTETVLKSDIPEKFQRTAHISREMQRQLAEELFNPVFADTAPFSLVHHSGNRNRSNPQIHENFDNPACKRDDDCDNQNHHT